MKRLKIILFSNIPAPYFVSYCEELSKYADLTVVFELKTATDRKQSWYKTSKSFETIYLNGMRFSNDTAFSLGYRKILKNNKYDLVIVCNPTTPTGICLLRYLKKRKMFFCIQSEGSFIGSGKGLKEWFKKKVISGANFYLSGMGEEKNYFFMYAHKDAKIYHYHFASYWDREIDRSIISVKDKEIIKNSLGLKAPFVITYAGRFVKGKGYYLALDLAKRLNNDERVMFCFAGGNPSKKDILFLNSNNIKNVKYFGFLDAESIKELFHASSLLILPSAIDTWGLVVNEAMSNGLPVLTTDTCVSGYEFFDKNHPECLMKTGDADDLFKKATYFINNQKCMLELSKYGLERIKYHSFEHMAKEIFDFISNEFSSFDPNC